MAGRRELLIDAFNVMFAHPRLGPLLRRDLQAARQEFLVLVNQNRPADATRVYVVFDAHRDPGPPGEANSQYSGSVHVVFARETADTWIQRRVRAHPEPQQLTVVTSDREILDTVKAYGARHLRVSEFLRLPARRRAARQRQAGADDKPASSSRREIEDLEKLFEERGEED